MTSTTTDRLSGARSTLGYKAPARVATTANITLSGFQTIDGVTLAAGDSNLRVLVKDQTDGKENGIYCAAALAWTRAKDFDGNTDIRNGTRVNVATGSVGQGVYEVTSTDPIVIGTSTITFADVSSTVTLNANYQRPILSESTSYTVTTADEGKFLQADSSSGDLTVTLPAAATAGDDFAIGIRHHGTANQVIIDPNGSELIHTTGANSVSAYSLIRLGHSVELVCNGTLWIITSEARPFGEGVMTIVDLLSTPPGSPQAGARYLIGSSPTGAWSSQSQHDVAEADGIGGWLFVTPPTNAGWFAYVQAVGGVSENRFYHYKNSAWVAFDPAGFGNWRRETSAYTAVAGDAIIADTTAVGAFTITLPLTPALGDVVRFVPGSSWESNNLTIDRNGNTIMGVSANLTADTTTAFALVWDGTDNDWRFV